MTFQPRDKIFAKVKGHPHWPCRINVLPTDVHVPKGKYPIFFYGTHEVYFLGAKDIFSYEKFKQKYGVYRNKPAFQAGLREIEEDPNILLYGKDSNAEAFLLRFYKFTPTGGGFTTSEASVAKRIHTDSNSESDECPAKRLHTETPVVTPLPPPPKKKKLNTPKKQPVRVRKNTPTMRSRSSNKYKSPKEEEKQETSPESIPIQSQRVSALRVRIRKNSDGLISSPAHESSLSSLSPSTADSVATMEHRQSIEESADEANLTMPNPSTDPLRITLKQVAITTTEQYTIATSNTQPPIYSITSTPSCTVAATTNTFMGVVANMTNPFIKKSTAVVTPQRRSRLLPEPSYDSSISSTHADKECRNSDLKTKTTPVSPNIKRNKQKSEGDIYSASGRTMKRKRRIKELPSGLVSSGSGSENGSCSIRSSVAPSECSEQQHQPMMKSLIESKISPKTSIQNKTRLITTPKTSSPLRLIAAGDTKQQEQQLKDLDTEARLLLIDRSIKSSLVRDHEDIATCVDRLETLDRTLISLPILAKCWTVVETIGKCRRYKRSMEVKIAAQKVFNKFLQLYATADKTELDLALIELSKHQQRHEKQRSTGLVDAKIGTLYNGPKTMSELFQVSVGVLAERRRLGRGTRGSIGTSPSHVTRFEETHGTRPTRSMPQNMTTVSELSINNLSLKPPLKDIPLPDEESTVKELLEVSVRPSDTAAEGGIPEEEYEVLDEYEEICEQRYTNTHPLPHYKQPFPRTDSMKERSSLKSDSVPMIETQIIPYNMVPPHLLPPANGQLPPAYQPDASIFPSPVSISQYPPNSNTIPFGGLPTTSFTYHPTNALPNVPFTATMASTNGLEVTPPQIASRAYVPHSLHPASDPPPPYKPYVPTRTNLDKSPVTHSSCPSQPNPHTQRGVRVHPQQPPALHHSGLPPHGDNPKSTNRPRAHDTMSHPVRSRSPHALPHPLEHYQRCLTSALVPENSEYPCPPHQRFNEGKQYRMPETRSDEIRYNNQRRYPPNSNNSATHPSAQHRGGIEDLDTRIARLIGAPEDKPEERSTGVSRPRSTFSSPPPPPPPLPTSQRILFTHRPPQQNQLLTNRLLPSTPDSPPRGSVDIDERHPRFRPSHHSKQFHPELVHERPSIERNRSSSSTTTSDRRPAREEDRELYSMLGV